MGVCDADENEIEEILYVINESNRTFFESIIPKEYFKVPVLNLEEIKEQMKERTFYSYKIDGKIVGVAALEELNSSLGEIHWMYVLPEYLRMGIGTTLIRHIESEAGKRNLSHLIVNTAEKAVWARNFYENLDYILVEIRSTPDGGVATYKKVLRLGKQ